MKMDGAPPVGLGDARLLAVALESRTPRRRGDELLADSVVGGRRYSAVIGALGLAERVRDEAATAPASASDDTHARLRLALALRALGDAEGFDQTLRPLPWVAFVDRPYREPRVPQHGASADAFAWRASQRCQRRALRDSGRITSPIRPRTCPVPSP